MSNPVEFWMRTGTMVRLGLHFTITAAFAGLLFWRGNLPELGSAIHAAGWHAALLAAPVAALSLAGQGARWWLLVRRAGVRVSYPVALRVFLAAGGLSVLVPMGAGTALRLQVLHRRYGVGRTALAGTIFVEGLLDIMVIGLLSLAVLPLLDPGQGAVPGTLAVIGAAMGLGAGGVVLLLARGRGEGWSWPRLPLIPARFQATIAHPARNLARGVGALGSGRSALVVVLLTVGTWMLSALAYGVMGKLFGLGVEPLGYLAAVILANLAGTVSITQGNIGTYEVVVRETLMRFGANGDQATAFAIAVHAAGLAGAVLVGLAAGWLLRLGRADLLPSGRRVPVREPVAP
jgi:uncharacterized membrane protein YbhN (UPF0104 family)